MKIRLFFANLLGKYGKFLVPKDYKYIVCWVSEKELIKSLEEPLRKSVYNKKELENIFEVCKNDM